MSHLNDAPLPSFPRFTLTCRERTLSASRPLIMGILNVTPDSFSDGGLYTKAEEAIEHGLWMLEQGAEIIDIGGESTRRNATPVPTDEELRRVVPVIEALRRYDVTLSIDTFKPEVARAALAAGVHIVNDVTGARDPAMLEVVADAKAALVLMHMRGTPATMQSLCHYENLIPDIISNLFERMNAARAAGIDSIIVDPGLGFAKTAPQNLALLRQLRAFHKLGAPLLVGPSRKSFIGAVTGQPAGERVEGTIAAAVICALQGVQVLRVHDVPEIRRALLVTEAIQNA